VERPHRCRQRGHALHGPQGEVNRCPAYFDQEGNGGGKASRSRRTSRGNSRICHLAALSNILGRGLSFPCPLAQSFEAGLVTNPLQNDRFPRASKYDRNWVFRHQMGPNAA
jgi:hypothetical protein